MSLSRLQDLTTVTLPRVAASGRLGDNVRFVKCLFDDNATPEAQFASSVCFIVAVFQSDRETIQQPLLVKYNMGNEAVRQWLKLDYQFRNEVVVYEEVLPFLAKYGKVEEIFPKYFYGSASESEDPNGYIVVLEDLRPAGFMLSPVLLDLDFHHCALTFKRLGEFHAMSFVAKQLNPKRFYEVVNQLIEARLFDDNKDDTNDLYALPFNRASEPLVTNGEYEDEINSFKRKLSGDAQEYLKSLLTPKEPMSVICHGDFCRNNILFKYENDSPVDVKFFDLATARYSSPMVDFSFFFFLNSSAESRKKNRDAYLRIYYEAICANIPSGIQVPTLEDFKEEFKLKAVYGFLISVFFKPAMMDPVPFNPEVEVHKTREERVAKLVTNGGVEGTEVIVNMLREILDLKLVL